MCITGRLQLSSMWPQRVIAENERKSGTTCKQCTTGLLLTGHRRPAPDGKNHALAIHQKVSPPTFLGGPDPRRRGDGELHAVRHAAPSKASGSRHVRTPEGAEERLTRERACAHPCRGRSRTPALQWRT